MLEPWQSSSLDFFELSIGIFGIIFKKKLNNKDLANEY